jgi:hypothetical protein
MAGSQKAIISYHVGKRDSDNTDRFIRDLAGFQARFQAVSYGRAVHH